MTLKVTGENSWSGSEVTLRYKYMDAAKFAAYNNVIATAAACPASRKWQGFGLV
jgi:hypothetical protein